MFSLSNSLSVENLIRTEQCFFDGQIPCRWANDGSGPLINFIPPANLYSAMIFRLLGFDYSISLILSQVLLFLINIYFLARLLPSRHLFLIFLPFTILSSLFSFSLPLAAVLFTYTLLKSKSELYRLISTLPLTIILISLPSTLSIFVFIPLAYFLIRRFTPSILPFILALFLSFFYLIPALFDPRPFTMVNRLAVPTVTTGIASISQYRTRSNFWRFTVNAPSNQTATIQLPTDFYPGWKILVDQKPVLPVNTFPLTISIPPGDHTVVAFLENTPLRLWSNLLTLFTFVFFTFKIVKSMTDEKNS